jgi:transposase
MATKSKSDNNRGAKGKYAEWIESDGLARIQGWARDGLTNEQIADKIGIHGATLYEWMNRFPEIAEALKKGKQPVDIAVENAMLKAAIGYDYEESVIESRYTEEGEEIVYKKTYKRRMPPNVTAQIFWLKNRRPDKWRDKPREIAAEFEDDGLVKALFSSDEDWTDETS